MPDVSASRFRFPWRFAPRLRGSAREDAVRAKEWRGTLRSRVAVWAGLLTLWTVGIEARLVYLQVIDHADLVARADRQQMMTLTPAAKRGDIFDRNGHVLAFSVDADTVTADPRQIDDPETVATELCQALDGCNGERRADILKQLKRSGAFAYLARQISPDESRRVKALDLPGITLITESRRYYPKKDLAAHVLGYVGLDNGGLGGIESAYDAQIRGKAGKVIIQTDARHKALYSRVERAPTPGSSLELTIDEYLQYIAERELKAGVDENRAAGGTAIIMDPHDGEILAMASYPTFNPNAFVRFDEDDRRNRAIQDIYEPGSTFKIVTASAALQEHLMTPETPIDTSPGYITFGRRTIRDDHKGLGTIPLTEVIAKSSNVGAIKVGMRLGAERLGEYISRFGFGQALAPDFRGVSPGIVWDPAKLDASALASVSMGYQVGVTALQMVTAASTVANGGHLIEPRVVRAFIKDGRRVEVPHKELRQAISPETAAEMTEIMEAVVDHGTAKNVKIAGYTIAGKTGTAHKIVNGRYSNTDYNASFVGFVPSRDPAIAIIVVMDSPHGPNSYYGATVSAPIFQRIAEASLRYLGVGPNLNAPPPVLVARHDPAQEGDITLASADGALIARAEPARSGLMPDVRGLSARRALKLLSNIGMTARMSGSGLVVQQSPEAGSPFDPDVVCTLQLGRTPPATGGTP